MRVMITKNTLLTQNIIKTYMAETILHFPLNDRNVHLVFLLYKPKLDKHVTWMQEYMKET